MGAATEHSPAQALRSTQAEVAKAMQLEEHTATELLASRNSLLEMRLHSLEQQVNDFNNDMRQVPARTVAALNAAVEAVPDFKPSFSMDWDPGPLPTPPPLFDGSFVSGTRTTTNGYLVHAPRNGAAAYLVDQHAAAPPPPPAMPPPPKYADPEFDPALYEDLEGSPFEPATKETVDALAEELRAIAREQLSILAGPRGAAAPPPMPPQTPAADEKEYVPAQAASSSTPPATRSPIKPAASESPLKSSPTTDADVKDTLRMLHESRADALEQLHASQMKAREAERAQMANLMDELQSWKKQNEKRMAELAVRTKEMAENAFKKVRPHQGGGLPPLPGGGPAPAAPAAASAALAESASLSTNGGTGSNINGGGIKMSPALRAARAGLTADDATGIMPTVKRTPRVPPAERMTARELSLAAGAPGNNSSLRSSRRPSSTPSSTAAPATALSRAEALAARRDAATIAIQERAARVSNLTRQAHEIEDGRSLRALQKELDSLKSSLSVYLGSGLVQ